MRKSESLAALSGLDKLAIKSPAKLNLLLRVLGARPDGYHEVELLNAGIGLFDLVKLERRAAGGIEIACSHPGVPEDESNLCHKAALAILDKMPHNDFGLRVEIEKNVPVAGGLGGGSSNAAATLAGLNAMLGRPFETAELMEMGTAIGADVPFFLYESPAWARGIGERLLPGPPMDDFHYVIISFDFGVSAGWAYKEFDLTGQGKCDNLRDLEKRDFVAAPANFHNDLQAVVASRYPEIGDAINALLEAGAEAALMSGSGPTVFGVFSNRKEAQSTARVITRSRGLMAMTARSVQGPLIAFEV